MTNFDDMMVDYPYAKDYAFDLWTPYKLQLTSSLWVLLLIVKTVLNCPGVLGLKFTTPYQASRHRWSY